MAIYKAAGVIRQVVFCTYFLECWVYIFNKPKANLTPQKPVLQQQRGTCFYTTNSYLFTISFMYNTLL